MKQNLFLFIIFFIYSTSSRAQTFAWASQAGGKSSDAGNFICVDKSGNTYVTGQYMDIATFGSNEFSCTGGSFDSNIFLVKYDPSGNLLWARSAGGPTGEEPRGLVVDMVGNIYMAGIFSSTALFGNHSLTSTSGFGMFLAKYDASGNCYSAQRIMASGGIILGMSIDKNDFLYFSGFFRGTAHFGSTTLVGTNYQGNDKETGYIAKYTNTGSAIWANKIVANETDLSCNSVDTDNLGNCYITGDFGSNNGSGVIFFSPSNTISLTQNQAIFTAKYDADGTVIWAASSLGVGGFAYKITADSIGNSFITGSFGDTTLFGPYTLTASGFLDIFIVKYSPSGSVEWARQAGGPYQSHGSSIALDKAGNCYITGMFTKSALFSDGSASYTLSASPDFSRQVFIAKYLANGLLSWAIQTESDNAQNIGMGIATGIDMAVHITGEYLRTTQFGNYSLFGDYYSTGLSNIFVAKIDQPMITEVPQLGANSQLIVFPNPTECVINIRYTSDEKNNLVINIINASGQTVYTESLTKFTGKYNKNLDLGRFANGQYSIQIINGKKEDARKFVLN